MHDNRIEYQAENPVREAFLHPVNIGYLLTVSVLALMFSGTPWMPSLIITIGIGAELLYLGTVPHQPWFHKHVTLRREARQRAMVDDEKQQFEGMEVRHQKKFLALKRTCDRIEDNFKALPPSFRILTQQLVARIASLKSEYLRQLVFQERYRQLLQDTSTGALTLEIRSLEVLLAANHTEQLRAVRNRRLEILKKRLEKIKSAEEKADICASRCDTIEDAVRYVYEKTLTMYHPDDFGDQMDEMMSELEDTSAHIRQMEDDAALQARYDRYMHG